MDISKLVKKNVYPLRAYDAKEIPCKIKLDANESPFGYPFPSNILSKIHTNRYPDPEAKTLKKLVAEDLNILPENILQGNGSDELIFLMVATFGGPILYPVPTFSMYGIISQALCEKKIEIPLDADFDIDLDGTLRAMRKFKPKIIFLSSPNNPTGNCFSSDKILRIIEQSRGIVVIDEAYQPFSSKKGFLPLLKDYRNLVIFRTLSKIGFAALRIGFLIGGVELVSQVNKVRLPFNVNAFSQAIAIAALKNKRKISETIRAIEGERERLLHEMRKIKKVTTYPSEANFILFRVDSPDEVYRRLIDRSILVRNLHGLIKGCLRVTVGTQKENRAFILALKDITDKANP